MVGSILFIKTSSPISWAIRKITNSPYSHVALSVTKDNNILVDSDILKKVRYFYNEYDTYDYVDFDLSIDEQKILLETIETYLRKDYDYLLIIGMLLKYMGLTKNLALWNREDRFHCSEMVRDIFVKLGIYISSEEYPTPQDLALALKDRIKKKV